MMNITQFVRPTILSLVPYSSARDEFSKEDAVFLDANERPIGSLNRYPDPYQTALKKEIAERKKIPVDQLFIGNGSDEIIYLLYRIFCEPKTDRALTFSPTYGMYDVSAKINDIELIQLPLDDDFQIEKANALSALTDPSIKLLFICSPNNPTGNILDPAIIERILRKMNGIVVIDEAYIDFSDHVSWSQRLDEFPNLIVCQTFSKAYGLAGARIGYAMANAQIIEFLNKVKPPYNVSELNQKAAIRCLENFEEIQQTIRLIKQERSFLIERLKSFSFIQHIYPTESNFVLIRVSDADHIYRFLIDREIVIRNRTNVVQNCVRITVGSPEENNALIEALKNYTL